MFHQSLDGEIKIVKAELEKVKLEYTKCVCYFCGAKCGYGNSCVPINKEKCCDDCNLKIVIPYRTNFY